MASHFFGLNDRTYRYSRTIGRSAQVGRGFFWPAAVVVGKDEVIYVVARSAPEVSEIHRAGVRVVMTNTEEEYLGDFGSYGKGDGQFIWPVSITLDSRQNVYVSDGWLQRISIFDKKGQFLDKWGITGSADGEFNSPSGLAFDKEDNLYLADSANHRVQIFSKDGKFLGRFGSEGSGEGQFNMPWGITIDHEGDVYVVDWRNDRVQKFGRDGTFLAAFGSQGDLVGQFNRPSDVAVDQDGDIYVADWLNHRVQVFTPEFRFVTEFRGNATISKWGEQQIRSGPDYMRMWGLITDMSAIQRFWYPVAVAVDEHGRVFVAEGPRHRLQVYIKGEMLLAGYTG